ncbi:hypothetical protein BV898_12684 [Hypsibius exemplaris]|uniref:Uncharacterized protein n=1 Tax=Hypsibius exemplaris TaxID=2072580 RepID=A0A1W0WCT5_HYPEX|nr:hypothetical protein BV898_12684 [Hypsibius exemplaris]
MVTTFQTVLVISHQAYKLILSKNLIFNEIPLAGLNSTIALKGLGGFSNLMPLKRCRTSPAPVTAVFAGTAQRLDSLKWDMFFGKRSLKLG